MASELSGGGGSITPVTPTQLLLPSVTITSTEGFTAAATVNITNQLLINIANSWNITVPAPTAPVAGQRCLIGNIGTTAGQLLIGLGNAVTLYPRCVIEIIWLGTTWGLLSNSEGQTLYLNESKNVGFLRNHRFTVSLTDPITILVADAQTLTPILGSGYVSSVIEAMVDGTSKDIWMTSASTPNAAYPTDLHRKRAFASASSFTTGLFSASYCCSFEGVFESSIHFGFRGATRNAVTFYMEISARTIIN